MHWLLGGLPTTAGYQNYGLFLIADGMGGHADGEQASAAAARAVITNLVRDFVAPWISGDNNDAAQPTVQDIFSLAFARANQLVHQVAPDGGTTLTCALLFANMLIIAHAGDSRAYVVTESLKVLTHDHSLAQRLQDVGQLSPEAAVEHPQRNVLYRAVGLRDFIEPDLLTVFLPTHGWLLLCTDGLWGVVPEDHILAEIQAAGDPQLACDRLLAEALALGGLDNITMILIRL
jgi:serine/threonine protein phosphatase PrpC